MKKKQEIGLSYVRELGMNTFRSYSSAHNHMVSKLGQDKTDELEQWFDSRCDKDLNSEKDFYEFKNSDFDLSMLVSEIFDAAYIRNMCNWFNKQIPYFSELSRLLRKGINLIDSIEDEYWSAEDDKALNLIGIDTEFTK